jgi:hypothetical protein
MWVGGGVWLQLDASPSGIGRRQGIIHPRTRKHFTLRGEPMLYCGELMILMLIMCIDIPDGAIIYGAGF